jgi:phosphopantetheinyl transferase
VVTEVRVVRIALSQPAATSELLATALGVAPGTLAISRVCERCGDPAHGRPVLAGGGPAFNVSHTDGLALVAVASEGVRVGIDVERVQPRRRLERLARRVLDDDAYAAWRDAPDQLRAFLGAWTAKEAYLKALGIGIATRLADVPSVVDGWTITAIDAGGDYVGALAVDRTDVVPVMQSAGTAS